MGRAMVGKFIHFKDEAEDRLQLDTEQIATQQQGELRN
jgi:hypothetical protein